MFTETDLRALMDAMGLLVFTPILLASFYGVYIRRVVMNKRG